MTTESNVEPVEEKPLNCQVSVDVPINAPDEPRFWFHARAGVDPKILPARIVMTMQLIDAEGTHMFHGLASMWSLDRGKTWNGPTRQATLERRQVTNDVFEVPANATPMWHKKTSKLILTGSTLLVSEKIKCHIPGGESFTAYSSYDENSNRWSKWKKLQMPPDPEFAYAHAGCTQAVELPGGDLLLPIYFGGHDNDANHKVTVVRCRFDGETLIYINHGTSLQLAIKRGLGEPSLTKFGANYYLTMRNDDGAYVATSKDGMQFDGFVEWKFDDGKPLGSCNTQQHWVTHSDGLFLVYTRDNADNDEVFRNRAPLFMARVDPKTVRVIRNTETVIFPKVGKSEFGNFGVCNIDENETWVTAGRGESKPNEPNVYVAKIRWSRPNRFVSDKY